MAIITKLDIQAKNTNRCNLYLDGKFYCGMEFIVALNHRLKVGMEIDEQELQEIVFDSEKEKTFSYAVDYICKYLPTEKQLIRKLYDRGCTKQLVDYVVNKCKEYSYIDDLKFAQSYAYQNRNIKGKLRIEQELLKKGIKKEYVQEALANFEENEDGCLVLARKKIKDKDLDDPKAYASLVRYLQYRGYDYDQIKSCIDTIKRERDND